MCGNQSLFTLFFFEYWFNMICTLNMSVFQLDCSQVKSKSNLRLVASLYYCIANGSPPSPSINYNLPISNAYISLNFQPIWVKLWILHLMTNLNKVYDTKPNLNLLKSQLISITSNVQISVNSQLIVFKILNLISVNSQLILFKIIPNPTTSNL